MMGDIQVLIVAGSELEVVHLMTDTAKPSMTNKESISSRHLTLLAHRPYAKHTDQTRPRLTLSAVIVSGTMGVRRGPAPG